MPNVVTGMMLALLSAVTTATAHAMLKAGRDKLAIRALIGLTGLLTMAPVCFWVARPTTAMLPWLFAASALHTAYQLVLIRSYDSSNFAVAYPIARGIAPISAAVLGMALLGDRMPLAGIAGVMLVSAGILLVAAGRDISRAGLIAATITGLLTTAYTVVDAHAIRIAPQPMTFVAWFFSVDGLIMLPLFYSIRRGQAGKLLRAEGRHGVLAGLVTLLSFGSALIALALAPVGTVSALRETSVVFSMVVAHAALKERVGWTQAGGALIISLGAVLIVVGQG